MLRLLLIVLGAAGALALLVGAGFYVSPESELARADAIVVVSGGDTGARAKAGIKLFQAGWAPQLIFSGAAEDPESPSNAEVMKSIALSQGIPPDVVIAETRSRTTRQNAEEVSVLLEALNYESIILVTSPYHQRRTMLEFQDRLGQEFAIINHPAPDPNWDRRWWWITPVGWYLTVSEYGKILFALLSQQISLVSFRLPANLH
ncbi:YdcF family protein [Candidatus Microgenomates bacterium]|nr:YdcF family protein [Candidatus Microgenomates bacterium]